MNDRNHHTPDTLLPRPVDLPRVEAVATELDFQFLSGDDRLIFPWPNHRVTLHFASESGLHLNALAQLRISLDMSSINEIAPMLNEWNSERLGPAAFLHLGDDGDVEIRLRESLSIEPGVSTEQLHHFLLVALETTEIAVNEFCEAFPDLIVDRGHTQHHDSTQASDEELADDDALRTKISGLVAPPHITGDVWDEEDSPLTTDIYGSEDVPMTDGEAEDTTWQRSADDNDRLDNIPMDHQANNDASDSTPPEFPREVTLTRIRDDLASIGIEKTQGEEDYLVAWINNVFIGFFVDNGPTFLVKGHWDAGMDPDKDFIKLFMMCNQWNEHSLTTKAFCHQDSGGLQVRVEFTVPVSQGLTDAQLQHNIALAVHHILRAIDSLSTEATGDSVVEWPESPK